MQRAEIESLIPHKGAMCLLDSVEEWDPIAIRCRTNTHLSPDNPLRRDGALSAVHLIEYGAQAMALHSGMLERSQGKKMVPGLLVTVRDVVLGAARIDDVGQPLDVRARRLAATAGGWLYSFEIAAGGRRLASGRVGVLPVPRHLRA